ncbi:hypothetical protein H5U35_02755 [Candidatus Aerophobetes bacterium]|nr:hypothetical protein [Candidatus Aerophobetes bacterium]
MRNRSYLERFVLKEMRSKTVKYPVFGEVVYRSLAGICELLEKTEKKFTLLAYVRKAEDGIDENVLYMQMSFKDEEERDTLWNLAGEKLAENIKEGMKKAISMEEKLEIENILVAVKSEK